MADLDIEKKLNDLGDHIDKKLELSKSEMGEEFKKVYKGEVETLVKEYNDKFDGMQKQYDELSLAFEKQKEAPKNVDRTFKSELAGQLEKSDNFKAFKEGNSSKASLNLKAILTTALNASGEVVEADRVAGVRMDPTRATRIRDLLATGTTTSDTIRFIKELSYTNNAAMRTDASAYGESEYRLEVEDAPVRSLGSTIELTKEMLGDFAGMNSYISSRLPAKVLNIEDARILFGNGSAPNIQGIMTSSGGTAFDETSTGAFFNHFAAADQSAYVNHFDVLVAAINQATLVEYKPTAIFLNPTDYHKILLEKASDNHYVFEMQNQGTILGVPVIKNTAVTADKFLVGDFRQGAQLYFRDSMSVEFSYENNANFERDLVTVKASERIALPIYRPNAFVWGDFSDAYTALI